METWEQSLITGYNPEEKRTVRETVLHRRGADALQMAIRRNQGLPGCQKFTIETEEMFTEFLKEWDPRTEAIPKEKGTWEYDYETGTGSAGL